MSTNYFCHSCREEVEGHVLESQEIQCSNCGGVFLELLGQGVESFLGNQNHTTINRGEDEATIVTPTTASNLSTNPFNTPESDVIDPTNLILPGIINQLLGIRPETSILTQPSQTTTAHDGIGSNNSGSGNISNNINTTTPGGRHPIGIVIRQRNIANDDILSALFGRSMIQQRGGNSFEDLLHHIMMNESSYAHHGASEEAIARLEKRTENLQELGECSISQEPFTENDVAIVLPCHHAFKENEILQWLRVNKTCPVCRISIE